MKYLVYSAFVSALLVSPLFLAVGCSASAGGECSVEGNKFCSGTGDEILICSSDLVLTTDMECTDGTSCEVGAEGPECVSEGGTGGTGGYGGSGGTGGAACIPDSPPDAPPTAPFCDPAEFNFDCCGYPDSYCDTVTNQCISLT